MSNQAIIFLCVGVVGLVLVVINVFLFVYSRKANKKIDKLLENGKVKDFKDIFLNQKERNDDLVKQLKEAFLRIDKLDKISERTVQKIGVVRFDSVNGTGGKQSFAVAVLDDKNDGFVISSLFVNEGNRVFAKPVKNGKSEYTLSKEELEAIDQAMKSNYSN
ncbi:MAG: DUF4446 family protein [Candidatus Staskawiczbacteria bacterium]|nr:DUF4446 family protein [Candidatus Staskawiczbacteria bacterium]